MEKLLREESARLKELSIVDDQERNREQFGYAFDIIKENWAYPWSIWSMPNKDVINVIKGETDLESIPCENLNEFHKGMLFEDLRQFVAQHIASGKQELCEARDYESCLKSKCLLFRDKDSGKGGEHGICSEFKTAFSKS